DQLNEDTWAVHIEKGNTEINGSFQAINQFFVRDYCADALFINRAEDTGNEGLRRSKLSYHPCRLEPKYMLQLK
ncbi:MAG: phosphatidylglycerol lysyltransferase domain-containing protein, partial [Clostridiales bacterium]